MSGFIRYMEQYTPSGVQRYKKIRNLLLFSQKKQKKLFSYISFTHIHTRCFRGCNLPGNTRRTTRSRYTICKTGTTICNLSISHAPYPHYLCHRTPRGVHDMQDKKRKLDSVAGSTERFYAGPAREKFRQKSVFFPDRCSSK